MRKPMFRAGASLGSGCLQLFPGRPANPVSTTNTRAAGRRQTPRTASPRPEKPLVTDGQHTSFRAHPEKRAVEKRPQQARRLPRQLPGKQADPRPRRVGAAEGPGHKTGPLAVGSRAPLRVGRGGRAKLASTLALSSGREKGAVSPGRGRGRGTAAQRHQRAWSSHATCTRGPWGRDINAEPSLDGSRLGRQVPQTDALAQVLWSLT